MQAGGLLDTGETLAAGRLEATRLQDANVQEAASSIVSTVEFHPKGQLLLAASLDRHIRFFNVDGLANAKVQTLFLEDMPVHKAAFTNHGAQVVATGRRPFFYIVDIERQNIERIDKLFAKSERSLEAFVSSPAVDGTFARQTFVCWCKC